MDKALSYIGICKKAGKLTLGAELTVNGIKEGGVKLAVIASDTAFNTRKRVKDACAYRGIPAYEADFTASELGHITGKANPVVTIGITDDGFAKAIINSKTTT